MASIKKKYINGVEYWDALDWLGTIQNNKKGIEGLALAGIYGPFLLVGAAYIVGQAIVELAINLYHSPNIVLGCLIVAAVATTIIYLWKAYPVFLIMAPVILMAPFLGVPVAVYLHRLYKERQVKLITAYPSRRKPYEPA